jgi:hypothetical protein
MLPFVCTLYYSMHSDIVHTNTASTYCALISLVVFAPGTDGLADSTCSD